MPIKQRAGRGPVTFVLIHASPGDSTQWASVAGALEPHGEVVLVDLPDHGTAPKSLDLDPDSSLRDVRAVLASLTQHPVVLAGFSYGAYLAARVLAEPPENVRGAILISGFAALSEAHAASHRALADQIETGALSVAELTRLLLGAVLGPAARSFGAFPQIEHAFSSMEPARFVRALRRGAGCAQPDRRVARIAAPSTILHARHDAAMPADYAEELARLGPARLLWIETPSHMLPLTHVDECVAALLEHA